MGGRMSGFPRPILAVHQPNFAPWIGYFMKVAMADRFVLLDDVQFPKASWVNRTHVLGPGGKEYLTVPVRHPGLSPIRDVLIADLAWAKKHARKFEAHYHGAPGLETAIEVLGDGGGEERLSAANEELIRRACRALDIATPLTRSSSLCLATSGPTERHIALCRRIGARTYLSGQGAAFYNDPVRFEEAGITLAYFSFEHPLYDQGREPFIPGLSVLDFLARTGPDAKRRFATAHAESSLR
jgi:hypothetical protein